MNAIITIILHPDAHEHGFQSLPLIAGVLASMIHVITGPDHLAAVTPLVIETKKRFWKIGFFWGLGHLLGMLIIGVLFMLFKDLIPVELISAYSELIVSVVLIGVGIWAIYRIFYEKKSHKHPHVHKEEETYIHIHEHTHDHKDEQHKHRRIFRQDDISSLGIGFIHGFAGVAHFLLLLPVLGFEDNLEAARYIIGFAIGTVLAMSAYAWILGTATKFTRHDHNVNFFKGLRLSGGLFAIIVGFYWMYLSV